MTISHLSHPVAQQKHTTVRASGHVRALLQRRSEAAENKNQHCTNEKGISYDFDNFISLFLVLACLHAQKCATQSVPVAGRPRSLKARQGRCRR